MGGGTRSSGGHFAKESGIILSYCQCNMENTIKDEETGEISVSLQYYLQA